MGEHIQRVSGSVTKRRSRSSPPWLCRSVMYQLFLRRFTAEGTLQAATQKLSWVADLSVDIVYLCPICLSDDDQREAFWSSRHKQSGSKNPRNPYRIKDYFTIDPEYGTDADLHHFVMTAHQLGLRVILDIVYLHCGPQAVFLDEHPDFVNRDETGAIRPGSWNFPELNFDNPELREYLWGNLEYWVTTFGVDGYRCDVSDRVPLDFWEEARRRLEAIAPEVIMLAEGRMPEGQLAAFDFSYSSEQNGALYAIMRGEQGVADYRRIWEALDNAWPSGRAFIRYTDNHDLANDHPSRIEGLWGAEAAEATLLMTFMLDGIPMLYNGQEIADATRHCIFAGVGETIDWTVAEGESGQARLTFVKRLLHLCRTESALIDGDVVWLDHSGPESVLVFTRHVDGEQILVVVNLCDEAVLLTLVGVGQARTVLAVSGVDVDGNTMHLQPYGYFAGKRQ